MYLQLREKNKYCKLILKSSYHWVQIWNVILSKKYEHNFVLCDQYASDIKLMATEAQSCFLIIIFALNNYILKILVKCKYARVYSS